MVVVCAAVSFTAKRTNHAKEVLRNFYEANINTLLEYPEDIQALADSFSSIYSADMTKKGFDDAMSRRLFAKSAKLSQELKADIHVKRVSLKKI